MPSAEEKQHLDRNKDDIAGMLSHIKKKYEAGFTKVETAPNAQWVSINFMPVDVNPAIPRGRMAEHSQILGTGNTAQEALDDWKVKFDQLPKSGDLLYWRALPEVNWDFDFDRGQVRWMVYARLVIFEHEEAR